MSNIEAYEGNLEARLQELKQGEQAYKLHYIVVAEAVIFAQEMHGEDGKQRIADFGCGLGFMTASLGQHFDVVGIDPSEKAISLAIQEHPETTFYNSDSESFFDMMTEQKVEPFDQALLNMVLHSVDDNSVSSILEGVRKCLKPEGTVILVVPTKDWLVQKLIEYAQDQHMERVPGIMWVGDKLERQEVTVPVKISGGEYYPEPLTFYNRTVEEYGTFLLNSGFCVRVNSFNTETEELIGSQTIPYWDLDDYTSRMLLESGGRRMLMSFAYGKAKINKWENEDCE